METFARKSVLAAMVGALVLAAAVGCVPKPLPTPKQVVVPTPIRNGTGTYKCPYTQDGVLALWVDKAVKAKLGASVGRTVGTYAGQRATRMIPFVGGFLGSKVGEHVGRAVVLKAAGGEAYIAQTSDLSFNNVNDLAVYMYAVHSSHKDYAGALQATQEIYPALKTSYLPAIRKASRPE